MLRHVYVSSQTVTSSPPWAADVRAPEFSIGFGVIKTGGGDRTFTVQHTFDNILASASANANATWFDHSSVSGKTASIDGNYAFPVNAVRINITAGSASATVALMLNQSG